ncbi:MAG: carbohydrate porin, partial [Cyanobacteria bacterium P01_E01_bin.34]
ITVAQEFAFSYSIEDRPGNFRLGWLWGNRDRINLSDPISLVGDDGTLDFRDPFQRSGSSYMVYANFDQYFFTLNPTFSKVDAEIAAESEATPEGPIFATPRGLGAFGRLGFGPADSNLVDFFASAGIGGKGLLPGRPYDQFGLGWYHLNFSGDLEDVLNSSRFLVFLNRGEFDLRPENGIEIYYTAAITPAIQLTADLQYIIEPGLSRSDSVLIAGGRLQLNF